MRLLLLNPNTTAAAPETEIIPLTASRGVPFISSRAEAQIAGAIVLEMLAEWHGRCDAAIIAAFADPDLLGARVVRRTGRRAR